MGFGSISGALVNEEVAHVDVGVAEVGAEDRFAEEVGEFAPGRVTTEEGAALVTRTVELLVCRAHVAPQAPEEGRQDLLFIA